MRRVWARILRETRRLLAGWAMGLALRLTPKDDADVLLALQALFLAAAHTVDADDRRQP